MYHTRQIQVSRSHELGVFFDKLCGNANNLYNVTCYYLRQYATALQSFEEMKPLYENQLDIYKKVQLLTEDTDYYPKGKWLNYYTIDYILKVLNDRDYYSLPAQVNQNVIKMALADFKSYFESIKKWKPNPSAFNGMPKMPYYKKSGSLTTVKLTNQICKIENGKLQFPYKHQLDVASLDINGTLKEVRIKPSLIGFTIDIVSEVSIDGEIINDDKHNEKLLAKYKEYIVLNERALAIDPGLSNLCTVVNNFGDNNFIIKGTYLKSVNHWYNKQLAHYQSIAKKDNDQYWTLRLERITQNRNNKIKDYMHKTTTYIANYAKEHGVTIVVIGHNKGQKQEIDLGKVTNQNFVQIPTTMLINQLQYKLNKFGIELVIVEESYTSQASFENMDYLPTYGKDDDKANFSGKRIKRGLYKTDGKNPINADVNGAANTFRKVFPNVREWNIGVVATPVLVNVV